MKTQVITLDKLEKFLNVRDRKIVSIVPHEYAVIEDAERYIIANKLMSVLVIYQEI